MRSTLTLGTALLLLLLQATVLELAPVHMVTPSLGLLAVLHLGLSSSRWSASSAALVAFCTGYLFDLVSGAPQGTHAFVFVLMSLFARAVAARFVVRGIVLTAATSFVASLFSALLIVVVRGQVSPEGGYAGLQQAPFEALLTALFGPPVLWLLSRLEGKLDSMRLRVGLSRRRSRVLGGGLPPR